MKTLNTARIGQIYYVNRILKSEHAGKLRELGFAPDKEVVLLSIDEENARLKIGQTRLALSSFYLNTILIKDEQSNEELVPLSSLNIGQSGVVRLLEGQGEIKRRLMDMGITRGTSISVHKLAPLGDPMELHLRGYSLSLRKKDAEKIKIVVQD
ncbi:MULTISPECIES: FeoA family protein [Lactococcus]|jgi:ferrous iron transport protein A|uniref:FeoA family protein n=1 Tax=Lactococcus TaxID=1357 RepID=UPI00254D5683|nr:ferrous iron transport protein A [Lactococcus petauri]